MKTSVKDGRREQKDEKNRGNRKTNEQKKTIMQRIDYKK